MTATTGRLVGRTIALPETRELDRLASLLEEEGATSLRCPLVSILDAPDPRPIETWLDQLGAGSFDDLILLTGEGLRRLLALAKRTGRYDAVVAALARVRKITRGPKPARALHEIGLSSDLPAAVPTSQGVMQELAVQNLKGRRVGVQLYGEEPNRELVDFLQRAGATVATVAPYIYASASDDKRVNALIAAMDAGQVDAIAFTSASQVDRLWQVAKDAGAEMVARLQAALARVRVAAIGPIVVEALRARGVRIDIVPDKSFVMKRLTALIAETLARDVPG
ncbi:MAG TPA: uroporphyrinogen-III synthase [Polyangia bacterium]|jgi:uroporphyrinogen-III synthase|nr:uroporphyrinogen-III synthase [Polyangia bacterium]